jgi:hypothetical protein
MRFNLEHSQSVSFSLDKDYRNTRICFGGIEFFN